MLSKIPARIWVMINLIGIAAAVVGNSVFQVFCRPAPWSTGVLLVCMPVAAFYPVWRQQARFAPLMGFINGISACICVYCILFLGEWNLWALALVPVGIGLLAYVPHVLLVQLVVFNLVRPMGKFTRPMFLGAMMLCLGSTVGLRLLWRHQSHFVQHQAIDKAAKIEPGFLAEKILGMHFLYHTRIDVYDGWRPPIHDPIVVIGSWGGQDDPFPENMSLEKRIALYQRTFPGLPVRLPCSCALQGSTAYFSDPRLLFYD